MNERNLLGLLAAVLFAVGAVLVIVVAASDPDTVTALLFAGLMLMALAHFLPPRIRR